MAGKHHAKSKSDMSKSRHHRRDLRGRGKAMKQQADIIKSRHLVDTIRLQENLSFCGCGFLGIYHVGVASCFHEYAPQLSMHKISGSSAGALVAVAHICGNLQLAYATTDILRVAIDARARTLGPLHPSFDINAIIRDALERGLPDDVHTRVSGKLHISLTRLDDLENVIVSKFDSKEDVIQALICSCFIPCWSGFAAPKYKGVAYIDGGFSNNLLILDDKTVTVSPFAGEADICPQDDVYNLLTISISNTSFSITPHNLYRLSHALIPPPPEVLSELCEQGFADGIRFLQKMKLISCTRCLQIRSSSSSLLVTNESTTTTTEIIEQTTFSTAYQRARGESTKSYDRQNINSTSTTTMTTTTTATMTPVDSNSLGHFGVSCDEEVDSELTYEQLAPPTFVDVDCDGCLLRRKNALRDVLPKLFTDRIREACDNVNESLSNWFYSHKPIKYLSYMAAPYYLPMNLSLALISKYWQQVPQIGCELYRYFTEIKDFFLEIARRLYERSTTSLLLPDSLVDKQVEKESSISVKITADCRSSSLRSLTSYECCLTIVLFGRQSLLSVKK